MYHAPQRIFFMIGVPLIIYGADRVFGVFYKTHLIESAYFERLGDSSCIVTFENPTSFGKQNSSYIYLMLPWLSKYQFHAFSVYPCGKSNHSQLCISKSGGWTGDLIKGITTPSHKPAFIVGPFLSPFSSSAMDSENLIAVASGIGVTPTISLIKQYMYTSRRLSLVWICRDAGLVEWFLKNVELSDTGFNLIYYTGKRSLVIERKLPANLFIYQGRPNLDRTITEIITSIASGEDLPQDSGEGLEMISHSKTPPEVKARLLLEKAMSIYSTDQLFTYAMEVSNSDNSALELEPLVDSVDYRGVLSLMQQLLKDNINYIKADLQKNFERFSSADSLLTKEGFQEFLSMMTSVKEDDRLTGSIYSHREKFTGRRESLGKLGSKYTMLPSKADSRIKSYLLGDGKFAAKNWSMFYCSGSAPVLQALKDFKHKHGVALSVEKFNW